ncbi:winged helix-turn-helix domain-containing protein [Myxosarcina sp. GI1(2024)]
MTQFILHTRSWIDELVWGDNRLGIESLGDQRKENKGAKPLLNEQQKALLWPTLQAPPVDGGLWTGTKVAAWMSDLLDIEIAPQRGWDYLRGLEYVRRRPRPAHLESDLQEQQRWKKAHRLRRGFLGVKTEQANWRRLPQKLNGNIPNQR